MFRMGWLTRERPQGHAGARLSTWCIRQVLPTFIVGCLMLLLATLATVCGTLLFQPLFDKGILERQGSILMPLVVLQVALFLTRGALAGVAFDVLTRASARLGQSLTLRIFDHFQKQPLSFFIDRPQADLLQVLRNDIAVLELNFGQTLGQAIIATLQSIAAILVILIWEPVLALLCVAGLGSGAALIWSASWLTNRAMPAEIAANASLSDHFLTVLGLRGFFLRISSTPEWGRARSQQLLERYRAALIRRRILPNWVLVSGEQLSTVTYFSFYLLGAYLVTGGTASTGALIAMAGLLGYLIGSLNQLAPTYVGLGDAWLRLKRIEHELASPTCTTEDVDAFVPRMLRGAFVLDRVTVSYQTTVALDEVSVSIRAGAITAIVGPSGAGKTTLTLLLLKVIEPHSGQLTLDGVEIHRYHREALWRHFGYVPQEPTLFRGTARENIVVGRPFTEAEIVRAASAAGIHDRLSAAAGGYDTDIGENGYRLSTGERQRLSLARALLGSPSVLVMDEPTANLDAETSAWIRSTIVGQRELGRTIVIVTHRPAILAIVDDVIALDKGTVVFSGSIGTPAIQAKLSETMQDPQPVKPKPH
jgi:ABC-type bacteriocin/lantibiotic exporter with double-glycine peptidase domain